jgi:hypothetical protein
MDDKLIFCIYARKSNRSNWNNYGRTDDKQHALTVVNKFHEDCAKDINHNWEISIQTIYKYTLDDKYNSQIPDNLKFNIYWPELGFIPFAQWQTKPDQSIYNGGN